MNKLQFWVFLLSFLFHRQILLGQCAQYRVILLRKTNCEQKCVLFWTTQIIAMECFCLGFRAPEIFMVVSIVCTCQLLLLEFSLIDTWRYSRYLSHSGSDRDHWVIRWFFTLMQTSSPYRLSMQCKGLCLYPKNGKRQIGSTGDGSIPRWRHASFLLANQRPSLYFPSSVAD